MKKVFFTITALCFLVTSNLNASTMMYTDCFDMAFADLDAYESGLGFYLSAADATEYVNDGYAVCDCMFNGNCYW